MRISTITLQTMGTTRKYALRGLAFLASLPIPSHQGNAFDVMFEKIEQRNGSDIYNLQQIRVRKFNRTVSVLDGTMRLLTDVDDRYKISVKVEYSTRGNNQFNQYPMKIAPDYVCNFFNTTWAEYYPYFKDTTNFPAVGECPIRAKEMTVRNQVLDSNIFPPYLPKGLWRLSLMLFPANEDTVLVYVSVYFKVEDKGIF